MEPAQGLSIPDYFTKYTTANGHGPVNTASGSFNDIANSIFHTAAAVSLIVTLFLDNTIPGTEVMGAFYSARRTACFVEKKRAGSGAMPVSLLCCLVAALLLQLPHMLLLGQLRHIGTCRCAGHYSAYSAAEASYATASCIKAEGLRRAGGKGPACLAHAGRNGLVGG